MTPPSRRTEPSASPTASFRSDREEIAARHRSGASGRSVVAALSDLHDRTLTAAFRAVPGSATSKLAVIALGGYGRREMCFASDCDVMFLAPDDADRSGETTIMQSFFHRLLDAGLDVGHSYRTLDDIPAVRDTGLDSWLSLLDARFVCGSKATYQRFLHVVRGVVQQSPPASFVRDLLALSQTRHQKYGRSTKLLEPNLKNSSGGLRDLQTVVWLLRGTGLEPVGSRHRRGTLEAILASPTLRRLFPPRFPARGLRAFDLLLRTRNEMHLFAGGLHDTLEFSVQGPIAAALGIRSVSGHGAVERFMMDYYDAANVAAELTARVALWARDRWLPSGESIARPIDDRLRIRGGRVDLVRSTRRLDTRTVLDAFRARLDHDAEFSFQLEDAIHRSLGGHRAIRSTDDASAFTALCERAHGISGTLQLMNRLGLLERWIPEWRPLVRFFQHNQYHYYTADEHTLRVVEYAEGLRTQLSVFGEAYRAMPRTDVLAFACLLHDIAKPVRVEDHEIAGVRVARRVLARLHRSDLADDVAFLVRHHLEMEQVAFRRNLADAATVKDFAGRFPKPELLDYLFCLTYADLSAVNKSVWTEWKASLLTDLYLRTRRVLRGHEEPAAPAVVPMPERWRRQFPEDALARHAGLLNEAAYRGAFAPDEIAEHLRVIGQGPTVHVLGQQWSEVTELTVIAPDADFFLSRCCGVLTANDGNIIDASIFTRDDGTVIDKFRVVDATTHAPLSGDRCRKIEEDLREVFAGEVDVEQLIERHRRRWKRKAGRHNPNIRIDVEFEDHPRFTIIDVYGADTLGFLYRITETMSRLGLSIHFAKIATRGDGIVDAFYVLDRSGQPLSDPDRRAVVQKQLRTTLRDLSHSELVPSPTP
ncbi:MAG: [protein-PII] uridylyltransferase [Bacteroidetes bacterium]|jgi:[protein-PII] uridylyltransferase|nr:[protein-PII] uridylyltransferase [Bacteroidota bacterium]